MDLAEGDNGRRRGESDLPIEQDSQAVQEIVAAAKHRLRKVPHLTVQRIWCELQEGHLILQGQVPTFYHKQLAQEAVAGLNGVKQVVNDIEVVW